MSIRALLPLADDSGLVVDALDGAPGVLSARYAGEHGNDDANNEKVLRELEGVADGERTARFVCSLGSSTKTEPIRRLRARLKDASLTACQARAASGMTLCFFPMNSKETKASPR